MGRRRHGSIVEDCPEVIGVLVYLHEKGDTWPIKWQSEQADLSVYAQIHATKVMGNPTATMADLNMVEKENEEDSAFYLTTTPDMV